MGPFLSGTFGNPSGSHSAARAAKTALEDAREEVAALLGAQPGEIVFTAGGTEADNLAVKGASRAARSAGGAGGERSGIVTTGVLDPESVAAAVDDHTALVSVMLVNNEVGTIQPLADIARRVRERSPRVLVHTDAVQAVPWLDVAEAAGAVDLVAISAHKFGGPKGTGALVVRGGVTLEPLIEGGEQERGLRSGTSNVAGAVAMAAALRVTCTERAADIDRIARLRDELLDGLLAAVPGAFENGDRSAKIAGNAHLGFPGVEAETLLVALDRADVCAAAGSSCSSGATDPSHVLAAMGIGRDDALSSIRLSLGFASTTRDVEVALAVIPRAVEQLRRAGAAA